MMTFIVMRMKLSLQQIRIQMVEVAWSNLLLFEIQEKIMESYHYVLTMFRSSNVSFLIAVLSVVGSLSLSFLTGLFTKSCSCPFFFHSLVAFSFIQLSFFLLFSSKSGKRELVSTKVEESI